MSVKFSFCTIAISILLFLALILFKIKEYSALAGAVGSFFFSIWSVRSFFGSEVKIFPTLLDHFVIWASFGLLFGVITKIAFGFFKNINE